MRITSKMMNNNSLTNINKNKTYLDKLNNQLASEKKITRPSDDPVIAIRALKLRANVSDITQYYDKNTNDASAWLQATQDAIESTKKILTSMKAQFTQGATGTNTTESRKAILQELKALRDQIYDDGNADYAGRTIFTGYRTGSKLTFQSQDDLNLQYTGIEESFSADDMDEITYVAGKLDTATQVVPADTTATASQTVTSTTAARIRLSYAGLDNTAPTLTIGGTAITPTIKTKADDAYTPGDDDVYFIPETGELILGKNVADTVNSSTDDNVVQISYDKSSWKVGDLRPEHYFNCTNATDGIVYDNNDPQAINYDVSSNQEMQINTYASQLYTHSIGRDIDEMISAIEDVDAASTKIDKLKSMLEKDNLTDTEKANIQSTLDAAQKEYDLASNKMQKMFENGQTRFDNHISTTVLAGTECGTRIERLDLVKNRLMELKTTANELADANENVELTDVAISASEAELTYQAALMATGKINQQSLLNYI